MQTEQTHIDLYDDVSNPLDGIEEIMLDNEWAFDRPTEDELSVNVMGKFGSYTMNFEWQEANSAMKFTCELDISVSQNNLVQAYKALNTINAQLWLGHFDISTPRFTPRFRHTSLFRGMNETSGVEHIEGLIDIAIKQCERFYMTFNVLSKQSVTIVSNDLNLAMMDASGNS